jgi:hypothetical protein
LFFNFVDSEEASMSKADENQMEIDEKLANEMENVAILSDEENGNLHVYIVGVLMYFMCVSCLDYLCMVRIFAALYRY